MANTEGMVVNFAVFKHDDIISAGPQALSAYSELVENVDSNRANFGKGINTYLVINTDEPYADEVIEIMKRHGHWG